MPDPQKTRLQFFDCDICKGFGYEVTGTKKHIKCKACSDNPSMFAMLDGEVSYWGTAATLDGIRQRTARTIFHYSFNIALMAAMVGGLAALLWGAYQFVIVDGGSLMDFFLTQQLYLAAAWAAVMLGLFLYYRLDQERESKRLFDYSEKAERNKKAVKKPANPTWEKFDRLPKRQKTDISEYFTQECIKAIDRSFGLAKKLDHHVITPLHLMGALLESPSIKVIMTRMGIQPKPIYEKLGRAMGMEGIESGSGIDLGLEANRVLFYAFEEARENQRSKVDVMELMSAIIHQDKWVNQIFYDLEVEDQTVRNVIEWVHIQRTLRERYRRWKKKAGRKPKGIMDRAMTARPSPLLESMSTDYTYVARMGGFFPMIGRDKEMDQVLRIFREHTGNIMMVGPSGVGKTTLFEGLAELMASEEVPKELQDKRLVVLDPGQLIAGAKGVGTVEGRMTQVINEIARAGNIILGIEDVHHLLNMRSTSGSEDVAGILMNALSRGLVKVIATTTTQEYNQFIAQRGTFIRRFQMVKVDELDKNSSIQVLEAKSGAAEYKNKVFFSYAAIEACVDLTTQFIQDRYLPAKALDIMNEAAGFTQSRKGENSLVTKDDIAELIAEKTGIQVASVTEDERDKLLRLEEIMHERIVGQDEAVNAVSSALRRAREGLRDTNRPIANLLFLGPTGVGKTETAKTIAEIYFGGEDKIIRLDMSEYQDVASMRRLIGTQGQQGQLTDAIRMQPFALVLLDELEKAHPDVLNIFLSVMDDGRITDGTGQTFDMSNTMIIATSNAGTQEIQNMVQAGLGADEIKTKLMEETLQRFFKPEFVNRFDNVVVFKPLTFEEVVDIANRMLTKVAQRLLEEKGIIMEVDADALVELADKGYDPKYGARPLRRVLQDTVDDALSKLMLSRQLGRRDIVMLKPGGVMEVKKAPGI
ncbi:MAG: ATP-dependent Clp protease ATP-binding subunit [Candidatus Kerfeldbacteria bacterium]